MAIFTMASHSVNLSPEAAILIIAGIMVITGILTIFFDVRRRKRCSTPAIATVVDIIRDRSSDSDGNDTVRYYPLLEFTLPDGRTITAKGNVSGRRYKSYKMGDAYSVKYNPDKPTQILMEGSRSSIPRAVVLFILAAVMTGVVIAAKTGAFDGLIQ